MLRDILEDHVDPWRQQSQDQSPAPGFPGFVGLFSAWCCLSRAQGGGGEGLELCFSNLTVQHTTQGTF